jgi:hypothetical protein
MSSNKMSSKKTPRNTPGRLHHFKNNILYVSNKTIKHDRMHTNKNKRASVKIILDKNILKPFGYTNIAKLSKPERQQILNKALASKIKPVTILRRLNALYVFNKNNNTKLASKFKNDMIYVKKSDAYKARLD